MKIKELLNKTGHGPWKIPGRNWRYYQEWNNALFLYWQVELSELEKFVPKDLEIDLFEGRPWISVVAFTMEKIRPKFLPNFSPISNFDEVNIRTYVKANNKSGVYFLGIEGGKSLSCTIAKGMSGLPYRFSKILRSAKQYNSTNSEFNDHLAVQFTVGNEIKKKTELEKWLIERYALFHDTKTTLNEFEIHHLEWPIHELELKQLDFKYSRFENLIKNQPNVVHYSQGVKVIAWGKITKGKN